MVSVRRALSGHGRKELPVVVAMYEIVQCMMLLAGTDYDLLIKSAVLRLTMMQHNGKYVREAPISVLNSPTPAQIPSLDPT
jgi:hypothetical protein